MWPFSQISFPWNFHSSNTNFQLPPARPSTWDFQFYPRKLFSFRYWAFRKVRSKASSFFSNTGLVPNSDPASQWSAFSFACRKNPNITQSNYKSGFLNVTHDVRDWCKDWWEKLTTNPNTFDKESWCHFEPRDYDVNMGSSLGQNVKRAAKSSWRSNLRSLATWVQNLAAQNPNGSSEPSTELQPILLEQGSKIFPDPLGEWNMSVEASSSEGIESSSSVLMDYYEDQIVNYSPASTLTQSINMALNSISLKFHKPQIQTPILNSAWCALNLSEDLAVLTDTPTFSTSFKFGLRDFQLIFEKLTINSRLASLKTSLHDSHTECDESYQKDLKPFWNHAKELEQSMKVIFGLLSSVERRYCALISQMRRTSMSYVLLVELEKHFIDLQHSVVDVHDLASATNEIVIDLREKVRKWNGSTGATVTQDQADDLKSLALKVSAIFVSQRDLQEATELADGRVFTVLMKIVNFSNIIEAE